MGGRPSSLNHPGCAQPAGGAAGSASLSISILNQSYEVEAKFTSNKEQAGHPEVAVVHFTFDKAYLEISAANEQIDFAALHLLQVLQSAVNVVQLSMAAPLNCNLDGRRGLSHLHALAIRMRFQLWYQSVVYRECFLPLHPTRAWLLPG